MAGIQLSGLSSGLDTDSIIAGLMQVEAAPRTQIVNQQTREQARHDKLQQVSDKLNALKLASDSLSSVLTWAPTADDRLWSTLKVLGGEQHPDGPALLLSGTWTGPASGFDAQLAGLLDQVPSPSVHTTHERGYLDAMLNDFIVAPYVKVLRWFDRIEHRWNRLVNGRRGPSAEAKPTESATTAPERNGAACSMASRCLCKASRAIEAEPVCASRSSSPIRQALMPSGPTWRTRVTASPPTRAVAVSVVTVHSMSKSGMPRRGASKCIWSRTRNADSPERSISAPNRSNASSASDGAMARA